MDLTVFLCVPWREQPSRVRPFKAMLEHYRPIVGDNIITADSGHEQWNAGASRNIAAREAIERGADVLLMCDADFICDHENLLSAIRTAPRSNRVQWPFTVFKQLTPRGTEQYFQGRAIHRCAAEPALASGGLRVATPETWLMTRGDPECFHGWGFEDTAWEHLHQLITGKGPQRHAGRAYAFWHEPQQRLAYRRNLTMVREFEQITEVSKAWEWLDARNNLNVTQ